MSDTKKPPAHRRSPLESPAAVTLMGTDKAPELIAPPSQRWESEHDLGRTIQMQAGAQPPSIPRPARPARISAAPKAGAIEGIELMVIDERHVVGGERRPWRAAEVWTKRRVYGLDSTFRCVEIIDRETGRPELTHEMIGARLGGGRLRDKDAVRFSYPLPLPGMEAMFSKGKKHGYTSVIERMVVRVRVLHTSADDVVPSWDEIASRWSEVPPRG